MASAAGWLFAALAAALSKTVAVAAQLTARQKDRVQKAGSVDGNEPALTAEEDVHPNPVSGAAASSSALKGVAGWRLSLALAVVAMLGASVRPRSLALSHTLTLDHIQPS